MWILKSEATWLQEFCYCGQDGKWRCKEHNKVILFRYRGVPWVWVHPKDRRERNSKKRQIVEIYCPECTPNHVSLVIQNPKMSLQDDEIEDWRDKETFTFGTRVHIGKDLVVHGTVEDETKFPQISIRDEGGKLHIAHYLSDQVTLCDCE